VELTGKRVIVTGAAQGIGEGVVRYFASQDCTVVSMDVKEELGAKVAAEATAQGPGTVTFVPCDVSNRARVFAAFDEAVAIMGGLDGLIHPAAISHHQDCADITEEDWDQVLGVNLKGTLFTNQAAFSHMKETGGRILNFSSQAGMVAYARQRDYNPSYAASKAAVLGFTRAVAYEWGKFGITVNAICPAMSTPMTAAAAQGKTPEEIAHMTNPLSFRGAIKGGGQTERDLAPFLAFMIGEGSRFISGQTLMVDGGSTLSR
jgi:NAD(P)-dependent dehydrogenase (short-subunit alcohol dehydrogenase family)